MQETEINVNLDHNLLSFPNYNIETERNSISSRVAMFISTEVEYIRRVDLEGDDSNLMVVDLVGDKSKSYYLPGKFAGQHSNYFFNV